MPHVVFTAHDAAYNDMAAITLPTLQRYAARHNYELYIDSEVEAVEKDACKARCWLELYRSGRYGVGDIGLWIDTDALVMEGSMSIDTAFWSEGGNPHFVWAYDWNGPNSGVWMARFTSQAAHFIQTYDYLARAMGWGDNWAMNQTMLLPPFRDWVKCISGRHMNSNLYAEHGIDGWLHKRHINAYQDGGWILHLAGLEYERRMALLKEYAAKAR